MFDAPSLDRIAYQNLAANILHKGSVRNPTSLVHGRADSNESKPSYILWERDVA